MQSEVDFDNTSKAFATKTDEQLIRSLWLFRLMKSPALVKVFSALTILALKIGLPIRSIIKKTIFRQFCGGEDLKEATKAVSDLQRSRIGSILDYSVEGKNDDKDFDMTKREVLKIISLAENNKAIPYTSLKLTGIMPSVCLERLSEGKSMRPEEIAMFEKGRSRLEEICQQAYGSKVPIYFDAEESWIQKAIDLLAEEMMKEYNKDSAIILTTLQMYRTDRLSYLHSLIAMAKKEGFSWG